MKIISIVSAKGGVGKTTLSANLGIALARSGVPVLVIDLDPQDALRLHFNGCSTAERGLARAALAGVNWQDAMLTTSSGCRLLPYGSAKESERMDFEQLLRDHPRQLRDNIAGLNLPADTVVILDTPPGPSVYLSQALTASNTVLIALLSDAASYATLPLMHSLLQQYCLNRPGFDNYAYLVNQVDNSRQLNSDVEHLMRMQFGARALPLVHQDQAIPEAMACNQFVGEYDPLCRAPQDMIAVCAQVLDLLRINDRVAA